MNSTSCRCFVLGCPNSEGISTNATFHEFPEFPLQEQWLIAIGRRDTFIIDERVCSEHFNSKDFENYDSTKVLKRNVVPTLNLPTESEKSLFISNPQLNTSTCEELEQLVRKYNGLEKSKPIKVPSNAICTVLKPIADKTYKYETAPLNTINVILFTDESKGRLQKSSPVEDPVHLSELSDQESADEHQLEYDDIRNCRTCLDEIEPNRGTLVTNVHHDDKTLKEMIVFCIPQMASTLLNTDLICSKCLESVNFCMNFIENCLKVEAELLENYVSVDSNDNENNVDDSCKNEYRHISLDHDYVPEIEPVCDISEDNTWKPSDRTIFYDPSSTKHECFKCDRVFKTKNYLLDHIRRLHNKPESKKKKTCGFDCEFCDKSFLTKLGYDLHLQLSHRDQGEKRGKFDSPSRFDTTKDLNSHYDVHPSGHLCHVCGKGVRNGANLKVHMRSHTDPNTHLCHKCGRGYKSHASLCLHLKHHNPDLKFRCDECPAFFQQRYRLNLHKRLRHLGIRDYKCSVCGRKFCRKNNLNSHYRLKHSEVRPYQCETCGVSFARADYLKRHTNCGEKSKRRGFTSHKRKYRFVRGDSGKALITCKLCDKVFKDVHMLRLHVRTHMTLRKYKCKTCNLTFTTGGNRDRHERVHEDSSFRCEVCFKRMETREALDEHCVTTHENSKKYKCHVCGELFGRKYLLHSHVAERHGNVEDFEKEKEVLYRVVMEDYLVEN